MAERTLTAAYRLQLHAGFTFADAEHVVPYLADLGVSHLYLSPILQAAPGSMHGYDVVDHSRVSTELGGGEALVSLATAAHARGLGVVCDVVPNHMCIPEPEHLNRQLWDVLGHGHRAESARWFDIDWDVCGDRLGLPLLGAPLDEVIDAGELVLDSIRLTQGGDQAVLRYYDHVFPVADGTQDTQGDDVAAVAARQHYLLGDWRDKARLLGHRRFFDVDTLIAVRVEDPDVFAATHAVLVDLHRRGILDGFRIDHPDGLADPEQYLARLAEATDGGWVVVEKILEGHERLPTTWATAGSTGYDAVNVIQTALAPPTGTALDAIWREVGGDETVAEVALAAKRQVLTELLAPEVARLSRLVRRAGADAGVDLADRHLADGDIGPALAELLAHVDVYRAYLRPGHRADPTALQRLDDIVAAARRARPDLSAALDALRLLVGDVDAASAAGRDLVVRFQQVCGPVMAKGVEDTTFYRYNRLTALNEVGGDPTALDSPGPQPLHAWAAHQQRHFPQALTTLSTHDTKRSEDVRARLLAMAGEVDAWTSLWKQVRTHADTGRVDGAMAYLVFQTLLGGWPIGADRLAPYVEKAMREAKHHTGWLNPDDDYEQRVQTFVTDCLHDQELTRQLAAVLERHGGVVRARTLTAKLWQLTLPGVPDIYQGCETVALSLVDPDNRRPVDFAALRFRLDRLDTYGPQHWAEPGAATDLDDAKLWLTAQALRLRRDHPRAFGEQATYQPLASSDQVVAFARQHPGAAGVTVVAAARLAAGTASVTLPDGGWRDVLTDRHHDATTSELFASLPVALLVSDTTGGDVSSPSGDRR